MATINLARRFLQSLMLALVVLWVLKLESAAQADVIYKVGAASTDITPSDWRTRTYWMAGYGLNRPLASVNDPLQARVLTIDDGKSPMAVVALDLIGVSSNDVNLIRSAILKDVPQLEGRILVHATHTHEGPDTIGLWGGAGEIPLVNPRPLSYIRDVGQKSAQAVKQAWGNRVPVSVTLANIDSSVLADLVIDSRAPKVSDPTAGLMVFKDTNSRTVATLVNWASHPEVLGSKNTAQTADYVKWVRDRFEAKLGGKAVFINGAIGGLMTSERRSILPQYPRYSFEKAAAVGTNVADRLLQRLAQPGAKDTVKTYTTLAPITYRTRRFFVPLENQALIVGQQLGRIPKTLFLQSQVPPQERRRSKQRFTFYTDTESNFITLGPAAILTVGGELYPELLVGGIQPRGVSPFNKAPAEIPLHSNPNIKSYPFKFFFGLTNDFIGYIIPQSEWDTIEGGAYGEEFAVSHDGGTIINSNLHLLMRGYTTGMYP